MEPLALAVGYLWIVLAVLWSLAYTIPQVVWSIARRTEFAKVLWIAMRKIYRERNGEN